MIDEELSAGVVACLGRPHESVAEDRVRVRLGEAGVRQLPRVRAVVADLDRAEPAPWRLGEMTAVAAAARELVRDRQPELSDAAVDAVANAYCFSWK